MLGRRAVSWVIFWILLLPNSGFAQTFPARDRMLRVMEAGDGPPVVLVPGWSQSLETWDFQAPVLETDFRVIRYDRGVWGAGSDPVDLVGLLDHLRIDRALVVGHSAGAAAVLRFATNYPERVVALVIYGPSGAPGLIRESDDDRWETHLTGLGVDPPNPFTIAARHGVDSLMVLARSHPFFRLPDGNSAARSLLDRIWSRYDGEDLQGPGGEALTRPVTEEALRRLTVPTLVVVGDDEVLHFKRAAQRLVELIPNAELAVVPGLCVFFCSFADSARLS